MRAFLLMLSVLLTFIKGHDGQKPNVKAIPNYPQVHIGDEMYLNCNGGSGETIKWYFKDIQQNVTSPLMLLTAVTSQNSGEYRCERGGQRSDPFTLNVLELEPFALLSPLGGTVLAKNDARHLVLQVDERDLERWRCFVYRDSKGFYLNFNRTTNSSIVYADIKDAKRATFWCRQLDTEQRSNAITLVSTERSVMLEPPAIPARNGDRVELKCVVWGGGKVELVQFYKGPDLIQNRKDDTYTITNVTLKKDSGKYSCSATYRYTHIDAKAAEKSGSSDPQELKISAGPPVASVEEPSSNSLRCSCHTCPDQCLNYRWYYTESDTSYTHTKLSEHSLYISPDKEGLYTCRAECQNGFSRLSKTYKYGAEAQGGSIVVILVTGLLIIAGVLIIVVAALKCRGRKESHLALGQDKEKDKQTGGDYEQIQLKDKAVYHTLSDAKGEEKVEGGYEALKKNEGEAVYHILGESVGQVSGQGSGQGGYEALKGVKTEDYQTIGSGKGQGEGKGEGQGGYEALKSVKAEVYHSLGPGKSDNPAEEAEAGYEKLPQKAADYEAVTVEENPYEELKEKKKTTEQEEKK